MLSRPKRILVWLIERAIEVLLLAILLFAVFGDEHYAGWEGTYGSLLRYAFLALCGITFSGYAITTLVVALSRFATSPARTLCNVALFILHLSVYVSVANQPSAVPLIVLGSCISTTASFFGDLIARALRGRKPPV